MRVLNVHQRVLPVPVATVGALLDTLASADDRLWPHAAWPRMHLDGPLAVGARGGHGPIRYRVEQYEPGRSVRFRFEQPRGFEGYHALVVEARGANACSLRHELAMRTHGSALLSWPFVYRPLHDALLEDALDRAQRSLATLPRPAQWSWWVRVLRALLAPRAPGPALRRSAEPTVPCTSGSSRALSHEPAGKDRG